MTWIFDKDNMKYLRDVRKKHGNVSVSWLIRKYKYTHEQTKNVRDSLKRTLKLCD